MLSFAGYSQNEELTSMVSLPKDIEQLTELELSKIADQLGDVKIIGTTERIHGYKEPFVFRNELIKYLVTSKRINIVLLESGFLESRYLNEYIHSKSNDLDFTILNGFSSGKQTIQENIELLAWLKTYNSDPKNSHKVDLYGFDVSGSMGAGSSKSEMNTPISTFISYLEKTAFERDSALIQKIKPRIDSLKVKPFIPDQENLASYEKLNQKTRNEVTSALNDLISNLETYRYEYMDQTTQEEYEWAYISAISARQIDNILRKFPLPGEPMNPEMIDLSFYNRLNGMVENVTFLLNHHQDSKFLIFAASNHLFKSPAETLWPGMSEAVSLPITVGRYLARKYPSDYKLISHFYLTAENEKSSLKDDPAVLSNSLEGTHPNYFVPIEFLDALDLSKKVKIEPNSFVMPSAAFDYILFTENISAHKRIK